MIRKQWRQTWWHHHKIFLTILNHRMREAFPGNLVILSISDCLFTMSETYTNLYTLLQDSLINFLQETMEEMDSSYQRRRTLETSTLSGILSFINKLVIFHCLLMIKTGNFLATFLSNSGTSTQCQSFKMIFKLIIINGKRKDISLLKNTSTLELIRTICLTLHILTMGSKLLRDRWRWLVTGLHTSSGISGIPNRRMDLARKHLRLQLKRS